MPEEQEDWDKYAVKKTEAPTDDWDKYAVKKKVGGNESGGSSSLLQSKLSQDQDLLNGNVFKQTPVTPSAPTQSKLVSDLYDYADKVKNQKQTPFTKVDNSQLPTTEINIPNTTIPNNLPKGDEIEYNHKSKVKEVATNAVKSKYANLGKFFDEKSPLVKKDINELIELEKNNDIAVVPGQDGKSYLTRGKGFFESLRDGIINSGLETVDAGKINSILDPKKLAETFNKRRGQMPNVPESVPTGFGSIGESIGGVPKMMGEASIPVVGEGLMAADAYQTARAKKMESLYWQGKEQGLTDADAASKAMKTSLVSAIPDAATAIALNRMGGKAATGMAENSFKQTVNTALKSIPKVSGLFGGSQLASDLTEKAFGYDTKDILEHTINAMGQGALMDLGFNILKMGAKVPSYMKASAKEFLTADVPKEALNEHLDNMGEDGQKIQQDLTTYQDARKKVEGLVPEDQMSTFAGLTEKRDTLEKSKEGKAKALTAPIDDQIKELDNRLTEMQKLGKTVEIDNLTGEPNIPIKEHKELKKQEREGIVVPKEYGNAEVVESGEGENKTFKPKASYIVHEGGLEISKPIKIEEEKTYADKDKAQKAADEALGKHYYENGMPETDKPILKGSPEKITKPIELNPEVTNQNEAKQPEISNSQESENIITEPSNKIEQPAAEATGTTLGTESDKIEDPNTGGRTVGISHSSLTDLAKKLGLGEPKEGDYWEPEHYAERGRRLLAAGADPKEAINPNNELHDRIAISRAHLEDLTRIADAMRKKWGNDSTQFKSAQKEANDYSADVVKKLGTLAHRGMVSLQGQRDLDTDSFTAVHTRAEEAKGKPLTPEQTKKVTQLTADNEKLKIQLDEAQQKLIEETDKHIGKKDTETKKYAKQAKSIADTFRKLKVKEFTFKDENGNEIPVTKMGMSWNDLVELGAKAIEKSGEVADGIKAILDKIKDTPFYQKLSEAKKEELQKQLADHYKTEIENTPEYKKIKRLEKELEDLQQGKVKSKGTPSEDSPRAKELKDRIFEEKDKLGLIPSKVKSIDEPNFGLEETQEVKNIRRLEKELEDLQAGKAKQTSPSRELTEKEKNLKEQIQDEKEKLGLVKSKQSKPLTEEEKTQLSEAKKEELQKQDEAKLKELQKKFVDKSDNKFTTEESKNIWDYAKKEYLDKGVSYRDMISQVGNDLGLSWRQVSEAITTPKLKHISDEMWKKQSDYKRNQNATKRWVEEQGIKSPAVKLFKGISDKIRGLAVFGHGGIFIGTHAGMTFFQPTTWNKTIPAFFRAWKFAYGNRGNYERAMEELRNRYNYVLAQRAGLKNNPDRVNSEEFQKSQSFLGKLGGAGEHGFNAIKVLRQDLFDGEWNKLSPEQKSELDKDGVPLAAKRIAELMNNATGASNLKIPEAVNEITFAGGMEAARWGKLIRNPIKATETALRAIIKPETASTSDKIFAKVWAKRVGQQIGTYATALAVNAAIQNTINPKDKVNLTDPNQPDWLKFKFGDVTIDPTSGMLGVINFIKGLGNITIEDQKELKGDSRMQAYGKKVIGYGRGKAAPGVGKIMDFAFQSDFTGNTMPFSNDKPKPGKHKLTWPEYAWQSAPLPIAEAAKTTYESANESGSNPATTEHIMKGILLGIISGTTGFRAGETKEKPTPYTEQDKNDPTFKYFYDKGLELPNTSPNSEVIKDEEAGVKKKLSDYPKEKIEAYNTAHKEYLKEKLSEVIDRGYVYVDKFGDVSINPSDKSEQIELSNLKKEQLAQILHISQGLATKKAKKEVLVVSQFR